jgi:hypothetical protein
MFVEKKNTPLSSLKSSVGATCLGGRFPIAGEKHVAPIIVPYGDIYGACGGDFPAFPVLQTCHSYGVYEEYFMLIAQVEQF